MKTKIISIILAVAIAVTGFTVRSSAIGEVLAGTVVGKILIGTAEFIAGSLGLEIGKNLTAEDFNVVEAIKNETVKNAVDAANRVVNMDSVKIYPNREYYNDGSYKTVYYASLNPDLNLTGDDLELATLIVDNLNALPDLTKICNDLGATESAVGGSTIAGGGGVSVTAYTDLKKAIGNATTEYTYEKYKQFAMENGITLLNDGAVPIYDFNFVGPIPSIEMPEHYTMAKQYIKDGFTFTKPIKGDGSAYFKSEEAAYAAGATKVTGSGTMWQGYVEAQYSVRGTYVIYNGVTYYCGRTDSDDLAETKFLNLKSAITPYTRDYKDINGNPLSDVYSEKMITDLYRGWYYSLNQDSEIPGLNVTDDDFSLATDGTTIDIPRTDEEQAIADGINLGIIDENGDLVLDEDGNIVSIDGLNIDKLMQLIQQIADNGSISFDSVEEYLAEISRLLRLANVDSTAMNTVISNLKELEKAQSKDISEINANVAAIAKALDMSKAEEETEFSGLVVEHTGLVEAGAIINELDIVQQTQGLVNNVLQSYEEGSVNKAPCFKFYWDSNKDGKKEIYDVLDLSFLDTTLTNENLVDKDRLKTPVTARYFIHCLMIFICYTFFAIKIIKKLPSLFGGSDDDFDEFKSTVSSGVKKIR